MNTIDWAEELKKVLEKYRWLMLFLLFGIPLIIHLLYKWKTGYSILEGEWDAGAMLAFYGAILGGSIGGIGTIVAVLITTKETRDIQKKNEVQLEIDRAEKKREERKIFAYSVTEDVAKFLANLTEYKDGSIEVKKYNQKITETYDKLYSVRYALDKKRLKTDLETKQEILTLETAEKGYLEVIQIHENGKKGYDISKIPAIERFMLLNIKLCEIDVAKELMDRLYNLLETSSNDTITKKAFLENLNEAMECTADFVEKYING